MEENKSFFVPTEKLEPSKSMLINYIIKKVRDYDEPTRKGTPIGQTIGFSRKKYAATLWLLTSVKTKDIAVNVGVSAGFLRKWKIEDAFKKKIKENEKEYIEYHWHHFKKLYVKNIWRKPLDDYRLYHINLFSAIREQTNVELKKIVTGKNISTQVEAENFRFMYWLTVFPQIGIGDPALKQLWRRKIKQLGETGYDIIEDKIKNPTKENLKEALNILKTLKSTHLCVLKEYYKIE